MLQQAGEDRTARLRPGVVVQVCQGEPGKLAEVVVPALFHVPYQGEEAVAPLAERHGRDQAEMAVLQHLHNGRGGGDEWFVLHGLQVDNLSESLYKRDDLVLTWDRLGENTNGKLVHR